MFRIGGIASGMDTQQIIKELMNAERIPMNRIFQKREWTVWQRDAYREVNLAISKFRDSFENLRLQTSFNALSATSGNTGIATATASGTAVPGSYVVEVQKMPEAAKIVSQAVLKDDNTKVKSSDNVFDVIGRDRESEDAADFALKIKVDGDKEAILNISKTDTFQSLASKISNLSYTVIEGDEEKQVSAGLRASFDNTTGTLMIVSREMGDAKQIEVINQPVDAADQESVNELWNKLFGTVEKATGEGQNGIVKVGDFLIDDLTSNKVTVHGVNLTVHQEGTTNVVVGSDPEKVFDTIKGFVESYNQLIENLQGKVNERRNRDYLPLTNEERQALSEKETELWDEKAKQGLLTNDPIITGLLNEMRLLISNPVQGIPDGQINSLAQLGITTTSDWRAGGKLQINEDQLRAAITNNPDEVMHLFTKRAEESGDKNSMGIGDRIFGVNGAINNSIKSLREKAGSPGNNSDTQSILAKDIKDVNDQLANWERRLMGIEDRYWKQFTAMEKALQKMNDQSAWIMANMFGGQ